MMRSLRGRRGTELGQEAGERRSGTRWLATPGRDTPVRHLAIASGWLVAKSSSPQALSFLDFATAQAHTFSYV